ncbi:MAG: sensor histidine kinase, partial [Rhodothermia bacterium]|nr:sensor histidine kinase [Rhodothermia bacterium]
AFRRELEFAKTRLRIASDLHDDIGSNLSGLALMSESVDGDPRDQEVVLGKIGEFARSMVDSLRDIVWSIDPESDRASHLVDRMRDAAAALLGGLDHSISTDLDEDVGLDPVVQRNIFLIYKEAINNAARHSGASRVIVDLSVRDGGVRLSIEDNGSGFDASDRTSGMGKRSMARRAEQIGGQLDIESEVGTGTKVTLSARMAQTRHSQPTNDL